MQSPSYSARKKSIEIRRFFSNPNDPNMNSLKSTTIAAIVGTLLATASSIQAQSDESLERAERMLTENASMILFVAHPTVSYSDCSVGSPVDVRGGGFRLMLRMNYTDLFDETGFTDIPIYFTQSGRLSSIGSGESNDGFPAFAVAGLAFESLRSAALGSDDLDDKAKAVISKIPDAKSLLTYLLQVKQMVK
ncbi:MAG: hypothetical protein ACI8UO_001658 [Verrucomicrobiales bacterium]